MIVSGLTCSIPSTGKAEMAAAAEWHSRIAGLFNKKLNVEVSSVDTDLFETGVLDSLAFVELLSLLENEFEMKVELNDLDIENFRSIRNIVKFVLERSRVRGWEDRAPTASPDTSNRESESRKSREVA